MLQSFWKSITLQKQAISTNSFNSARYVMYLKKNLLVNASNYLLVGWVIQKRLKKCNWRRRLKSIFFKSSVWKCKSPFFQSGKTFLNLGKNSVICYSYRVVRLTRSKNDSHKGSSSLGNFHHFHKELKMGKKFFVIKR